jgi:hypothetical protein
MTVKELLMVMAEDQDAFICVKDGYFVNPVEFTSGKRTNTAYGDFRVSELYEYDGYIRIVAER